MPVTQIEFPILQSFFCVVENVTGLPPQPLDASPKQLKMLEEREKEDKPLPKGVVLGPDGKPYVQFCPVRKEGDRLTGGV